MNGRSVGHEVGAFEYDCADLSMPRHEAPGGFHCFLFPSLVSIVRGKPQQGALETAILDQPNNGNIERRADALEMRPAETCAIEGEHARAFPPGKKPVDHWNLHQGAGRDGNA